MPSQSLGKIEFYRFKNARNAQILQIIENGEQALNIQFENKNAIVQAAHGNLSLAQRLCYELCASAHVEQTQQNMKVIPFDIDNAIERINVYLDYIFAEPVKSFIGLGNAKDTICLYLLDGLASAGDNFLSLSSFRANGLIRDDEINQFVHDSWMDQFYAKYPEAINYLFFEKTSQRFKVTDRQFLFYLKHRNLSELAQEVGKTPIPLVFVSYSHTDEYYQKRLEINLKPLERAMHIIYWADTKLQAEQNWQAKIEKVIKAAKAAILLISADFLASGFITLYELPRILEQADSRKTLIFPVILSPCLINLSRLGHLQFANPLNEPLSSKDKGEQDGIFTDLANLLMRHFP